MSRGNGGNYRNRGQQDNGGQNSYQNRQNNEVNALAVIEPPRMLLANVPATLIAEHNLTEVKWRALVDAVFPSAKTIGGVVLALDYCKARGLDPFKRPVHVVPMYNSKLGREVETVWPGIGELRTTAARTGLHAGNDDIVFGRMCRQAFRDGRSGQGSNGQPYSTTVTCPELDFPEWAQMTVYKIVAGQRVPFVGPKVFFIETFSGEKGLRVPNARWKQAPRGMLEKCAEAAALRRAFPEEMGTMMTSDEMEGKVVTDDIPQAEYSDVSNGSAGEARQGGDQQQDQGQREQGQQQSGGGDAWPDDAQEEYLIWLGETLAGCRSIRVLDRGLTEEQERISNLSQERQDKVDDMVSDTRTRIANARKAASSDQQQASAGDQSQDDQGGGDQPRGQDQQQEQPQQQDELPYIRNMRRTINDAELLVDLDSIEAAERSTIDELPAKHARVIEQLFADRRAALKGE